MTPVDRNAEAQGVRAMILGTLAGTMLGSDYPVLIRGHEEWLDEKNIIQAVSVVTASGLKFRIAVEYEGEEPS